MPRSGTMRKRLAEKQAGKRDKLNKKPPKLTDTLKGKRFLGGSSGGC